MRAWKRAPLVIFLIALTVLISTSAFSAELPPNIDEVKYGANGSKTEIGYRITTGGTNAVTVVGGTSVSRRITPFIVKSDDWTHADLGHAPGSDTWYACDPKTFVNGLDNEGVEINGVPTGNQASLTGYVQIESIYLRSDPTQYVNSYYWCLDPDAVGIQSPALKNPPPTYEEVWTQGLSQAFDDLSANSAAYIAPADPGLTGLPTRVWAHFADRQSLSSSITIRGYTITTNAYVSRVAITEKSPKGHVSTLAILTPESDGTIHGGDFYNPAATYFFKVKGVHTVSTVIEWTADDLTMTGPMLLEPLRIPLGTLRIELIRDYQVNELRPGLTR